MKNNTKYLEIFRLEILTATKELAIFVWCRNILLATSCNPNPKAYSRPLDCRLICKNS